MLRLQWEVFHRLAIYVGFAIEASADLYLQGNKYLKMNEIRISVIIPVYNTEKYLQACIDCMLAQTLDGMEFIFVNDASPDGSLALLLENEEKYPDRIRVIDSPENLRQGGARNLGMRAARGDYIGFSDSDDLIRPDMYERLYQAIAGTAADAAFSWMIELGEDITIESALSADAEEQRPDWIEWAKSISGKRLSDPDRMELMRLPLGGSVTWIYRREYLLGQELFFPEHLRYEDNGWAPLVKALLSEVCFVDNPCYFYRRNAASTTLSRNSPGVYERITVEEGALEEFKKRGLYERFLPVIEYAYIVRRTFMTYGFFVYTYDDPPENMLRYLMKSLKSAFPNWRKNGLYHRYHSRGSRAKDCIKYRFPLLYCKVMNRVKR